MFEWVYFAGASGTMEQISVYGSRLKLGEVLAQKVQQHIAEGRIEVDVVAPVPETSRPASIALAESLSIPYREIFIKSRYIQRSFILNTQEERDNAIQHKLSPIVSEIKGKNILLVDDSVVRGTTSRAIIALLKNNGAKRISLAITCPPIRFPCYYGIDFPDPSVLVATNRTEEEIAKWIGVDQVIYIDEQDLKEAIGKENLCMGCLNGTYPTKIRGCDEFRKHRSAK